MQAVIFDIDGTLLDSVDLHALAWRRAFKHFGKDIEFLEIRDQMGKTWDELLAKFLSPEEVDTFGDQLKEYRNEIFQKEYLNKVTAFPYVRDLIKCIKEHNCLVALGSSANEQELEAFMRLLDIDDLVDARSSGDETRGAKPHADIFQLSLEKLCVDAKDAIVVANSPHDAETASKANLKVVGLRCGGFPDHLLLNSGVVALFKDPGDLFQHYNASPIAV